MTVKQIKERFQRHGYYIERVAPQIVKVQKEFPELGPYRIFRSFAEAYRFYFMQ